MGAAFIPETTEDIAEVADKKYVTDTEKSNLHAPGDDNQDLSGLELLSNKSTNVTTDAASDTKYPSVKAVKDYADSLVVGLIDDRGNYDASVNTYPATGGSGAAGAILKGDLWFISVAGALNSVSVTIGDQLRALVNAPGQTPANWVVSEANVGYVPEPALSTATSDALPMDTDEVITRREGVTYRTTWSNVWSYLKIKTGGLYVAITSPLIVETRTDPAVANAGTSTLDLTLGRSFKLDASALAAGNAFTVTLSNVPAGTNIVALTLLLKIGTNIPTITWPAGVTAPTLVASKTAWYTVVTEDSGTTWRLFSAGAF